MSNLRRAALPILASIAAACAAAPPPPPAAQTEIAQLAATPPPAAAPANPAAPDEREPAIALDTRVKLGKLPNGLTYYVLPHPKPEKRAYLWLVVNAGSVLEDEDQRGLAHFVEHMGFNGTRRFPKQAMIDLLEKMGVKFGPHLNAYTSFDETVYMLQVPTDQAALVDKGLEVLRDWAGDVTLDPGEVDKERGVVLEEWRLGRGAGMRLFEKQAPVFLRGSDYARRLPIGKAEVIKGAPRERLVKFYRDWYRPDLMAVIAVGDVSAPEIERKIAATFSDLRNPPAPRPRPEAGVPPHGETLVSIETDPEMPMTSVGILRKMPRRPERSEKDYRRILAEQLYNAMLNMRLDELRRKPAAPFSQAFSGSQTFVRGADIFAQQAIAKEGAAEEALAVLVEELARLERHGFRPSELERARKQLLRGARQAAAERDKRDGAEFARELVRHFLEGELMPGPEGELALHEKLLPTFTVEELSGLAKAIAASSSRVIMMSGPDKMKKPAPERLLALVTETEKKEVAPYEDAVAAGPLMAQKPAPGKIVSRRAIPEIGVTEWKLSNGARVVVKPTTFRNDEVRLSGFSPGGHSLVKDGDYDAARFSGTIAHQGGLGQLDAVSIRKALAGRIANVSSGVGELEEYANGRASPEDLEPFFELLHLAFTAPRRDEIAFKAWKAREIEQVRNRRLSPERVFFEDMQVFLSSNHKRRQPTTPEVLDRVELDRALAVYKERFADAGDFTFIVVGNVDLAKLEPLVATYVASLPAKKRKESWRDVGVRRPKGGQTKVVERGREPKSQVMMSFHGTERWSRDNENDMRALGEVLRIRLREVLREELGGVYGVSAAGGIARRPRPEYSFTVSFGCSPDNVETLRQKVLDEIASLARNGIGADYLDKVKQARRRAHEVDLKENSFWENELEEAYRYGLDPKLIVDVEPLIARISSDRIKAAARRYLRPETLVVGVLKPEAGLAAAGAAN
jgi:zinc protease